MKKKESKTEGPPQRSTTRAPVPTNPLKGIRFIPFKKLTSEDLEELPKKMPGCPRWIDGERLMYCAELLNSELKTFIEKKKLKAYGKDGSIYYPGLDDFVRLENLRFGFADVFELENQGLFYMGDNEDIQAYRQIFQAWKEGFNNKKLPKEDNKGLSFKEKKLRPDQKHKIECMKVAEKLWKKDPTITIADMCFKNEINEIFEGKTYSDKTIRNWIKHLCPNRSPGRRPKK